MFEFNAINHTVFDIPGYFFFTIVGLVVSISIYIVLLYEKRLSLPQNVMILFISFIFSFAFSKLFGCISGIYRDIGLNQKISLDSIMQTGIVYYGGLFGLLFSYMTCLKMVHQYVEAINVLAVCIPLFHSVSRVGCFFGGCCYGKESNSLFTINYTTRELGEIITAQRIPIQLIEAIFNLGIFLYLLKLIHSDNWENQHILKKYLLVYSIGRFIIEFLRGDIARGVIFGVSFSQIISICIWVLLVYQESKNSKEETNTWVY